jgi:protein-tyrosine phosphatase
MRSPLYVVDTPVAGRLATMAHPRGGDWLEDECAGLAEAGVDLLVSALTDDELKELSLTREADAVHAAGLRFVRYPIPDVTLPPSMPEELRLSAELAAQVEDGKFVVTHCRAGIGRSSMLAGAVLVRLGVSPDEAWARIRQARGLPVPDNYEQERWLFTFAEALAAETAGRPG